MNDAASPLSDGSPVLFRAVIHPHRSLSPAGFRRLIWCVGALSLITGLGFFLSGAWPVIGFMGVDVALLYWAFKASYRSGRAFETVELTDQALRVERVDPFNRRQVWTLPPGWLRVHLDEPLKPGSQITLSSHGRQLVVGSDLSPDERRDFAEALRKALENWRDVR
ncbi:hypothetical protein CHU95_08345 [Niveispirillum lacus]|uniref:DUF2244 domain-containing protein n=1 Tax=Niveispirillum lacus TaxID=1981099 RepID=A0A255Z3I4_9PROT|nr:DUF2244 domain-containing protein [Niveispirillum lacus]OYQ35230.1 hypothetical protein CHU95_08345 [Niveispirillum lacus]